MADEIRQYLVLDYPVTSDTSLEERERMATGMWEQGCALDSVLTILGLGLNDNRELYIENPSPKLLQ